MDRIKNNNGFTLIEVLGVLIILSIIFTLVFPNVLNSFKKAEDSIDDATKKLIVDATKDYMNMNPVDYIESERFTYCVSIQSLFDNGLIKDTSDLQLSELNSFVKIISLNSSLSYELTDECNISVGSVFSLKGSSNVIVELFGTYTEAGVNARDTADNDISGEIEKHIYNDNGVEVTSINTSTLNNYKISYVLTTDNVSRKLERTVQVVDTTAPIITIPSDNNFTSDITTYDLTDGLIIADNSGETIKPIIKTDLTLGVPGTYYVTYIAIDKSGNKTEKNRIIQIYVKGLSYPAILTCTNGRTLVEGNCVNTYTNNEEKCGCKTYKSCQTANCGTSTSSYPCVKYFCSSGCGKCYSCGSEVCGCELDGGSWVSGNSTCTTTSTNTCPNVACGCSVANDCTLTENEYKTYTCPNGVTLDGTICEI